MKKLKNQLNKLKSTIKLKVSKKQLSEDGQKVTDWEKNYLYSTNFKCPNCEGGQLYEGPSGGMSTNIRCRVCGQGYNVTPMIGLIENIGIDESWIDEQYVRSLKLNKIKKS
jgi:transcription elongation factor Elf1